MKGLILTQILIFSMSPIFGDVTQEFKFCVHINLKTNRAQKIESILSEQIVEDSKIIYQEEDAEDSIHIWNFQIENLKGQNLTDLKNQVGLFVKIPISPYFISFNNKCRFYIKEINSKQYLTIFAKTFEFPDLKDIEFLIEKNYVREYALDYMYNLLFTYASLNYYNLDFTSLSFQDVKFFNVNEPIFTNVDKIREQKPNSNNLKSLIALFKHFNTLLNSNQVDYIIERMQTADSSKEALKILIYETIDYYNKKCKTKNIDFGQIFAMNKQQQILNEANIEKQQFRKIKLDLFRTFSQMKRTQAQEDQILFKAFDQQQSYSLQDNKVDERIKEYADMSQVQEQIIKNLSKLGVNDEEEIEKTKAIMKIKHPQLVEGTQQYYSQMMYEVLLQNPLITKEQKKQKPRDCGICGCSIFI